MLKEKRKRIFLMGTSLLLNSLLYNGIVIPLNLIVGGSGGVGAILYYRYKIIPALTITILSFIFLVISRIFLGKERTIGSIFSVIAYPALIEGTSFFKFPLLEDTTQILGIILLSGVVSGVSSSLMYQSLYSNGGFPILSQVLFEKYKIPITKSSFVINFIIIITSFFLAKTNFFYSILYLITQNITMRQILNSKSCKKKKLS